MGLGAPDSASTGATVNLSSLGIGVLLGMVVVYVIDTFVLNCIIKPSVLDDFCACFQAKSMPCHFHE